jgi:uncharacterized protein YjiS (DUF1127 family)
LSIAGRFSQRRRRLGRLVDHLVRLDDRLLAEMGISRSEIAALKL